MTPSEADLLLHLPCNTAEGRLLEDTSPYATHVSLPDRVELRPDIDFGRALTFDPGSQGVDVRLGELPEWALTIAVWIRADEATAGKDYVSILQYPISADTHADPYFVFGLYLVAGRLHARVGARHTGLTGKVIEPEKWHHLAVTWDSATKTVVYFLDGKPVPANVEGTLVDTVETEVGVLNYPDRNLPLLIGANAIGEETFSGRMAGIRVYGRALAADEMSALVHEEKHERPHPFDHHHPLGFRVADDRGHPAVYIVEDSSHGRTLNLVFTNSSPIAIELPASITKDGHLALAGSHRPTRDDHHLEIVFRPGTLDPEKVSRISTVDTNWHVNAMSNDDGTHSLFLSRPHGLLIPPGGVLTVSLTHVRAMLTGGSRPTQVELRYRHLRYLGDSQKINGHRLTHLDIVNQRGRADSPFAAGFIGSNTVLNDGKTRNTLTLYLGNPSLEKLQLSHVDPDARPRLILSFDSGRLDENNEPWALGHADEIAEIEITPDKMGWGIHKNEEGETPEWMIQPPKADLPSNRWINFTLYPIVTGSPSGFTNLYIRYQNIPGFRDGQIVVPIEKAPRVYRQKPVSESNRAPVSDVRPRSVHAFADSVVVGSNYAKERADDRPSPPPYPDADSLLVEGKIGIGTGDESPKGKLHVNGDYYGKGHLWLHAYEGDGNSGTAYLQARDTSSHSSVALQLRTKNQKTVVNALRLTAEGDAKILGTIEDKNGPVVPIGTIVMWSLRTEGIPRDIPRGWVLCNGENDTPDLRGRFIVGYSEGGEPNREDLKKLEDSLGRKPNEKEIEKLRNNDCSKIGNAAGEKEHKLITEEMPGHKHSGTTNKDGEHYHHVPIWRDQGRNQSRFDPGNGWQFEDVDEVKNKTPDSAPTTAKVPSSHRHSFTSNSSGGDIAHENRPPYYVLAFIMKIS